MIKGKRAFLANILYHSFAYQGLKHFGTKSLVIFNYHRIRANDQKDYVFDEGVYGPTQDTLRAHLKWLKKNTNLISEAELLDHVRGTRPLSKPSVMITFDDGYRDNAELALPVLKELNIPAIFFISTEAIENRQLGWWDLISYLVKQSPLNQIQFRETTFDLKQCSAWSIRRIQEWMRTLPAYQTHSLIRDLSEACQVPIPDREITSNELMDWEQIKAVADAGISIGSHTHTHRVLSTLSPQEQMEEFTVSKRILEEKLGRKIQSVAYPVGGHDDCHRETGEIAERCGYKLGFSFQTGFNSVSQIEPFGIRRVSAEESISLTCAATSLPSLFARSRTGDRPTRTIASYFMDAPKVVSEGTWARQATSGLLILSMLLGSQPVMAQHHAPEHHEATQESTDNEDEEDISSTSEPDLILAPGFKIHLSCPTDSKLNGDFRIGQDGKLNLPYNVTVAAAGVKLKNFETILENHYQPYFRNRPKIYVNVKQRRYWVRVLGVVKNPGSYLIKERTTLDEALSLAGVRTEDVPNGYVRLGSGKSSRWISMEDYLKGGPSHDLPPWKGGEQILFQLDRPENEAISKQDGSEESTPSTRKVQVVGEVRNPGSVTIQNKEDAYYYLIQRGGPTQNADLSKVELLRRDPKSNHHEQVTLGDLGKIRNIQESDILLVHADRPSSFNRTLQNTALIASIISAVVLAAFVVKE